MHRVLPFIQFLPISIFLGVARHYDFTNEAWIHAFQWGAIAGTLQLLILLPLLGNRLNRMIGGSNLFLIIGGFAFYFDFTRLLQLFDQLRAAGIIASIGIVCLLTTIFTPTGIFESKISNLGLEKKYSFYFLVGIGFAFLWALKHRSDTLIGGTVAFVFLILLKQFLEQKLRRSSAISRAS